MHDVSRMSRVICILLLFFAYFCYHATYGDKGLLTMMETKEKFAEARDTLSILKRRRMELEREIAMLQPGNYDMDFVDEIARKRFFYIAPGEKVILLERSGK